MLEGRRDPLESGGHHSPGRGDSAGTGRRMAVADRRYFSAESMQQLTTPTLSATAQEILAAIA